MTLISAPTPDPFAASAANGPRVRWGALVVATLARLVLVFIGSLVTLGLLPAVLGWHPSVVMSGSMEPRLHVGDLAVSRPVPSDQLALGQVLLVHDPDHPGRLRLHRLHAFEPDGTLQLRGDANPEPDSSHVRRSAVLGVGVLRVPWVGLPSVWAQEHRPLPLAALAVGVIATIALARLNTGEADPGARTKPADLDDPLPRRRRRWPLVIAGVGVVAIAATVAVNTDSAGASWSSTATTTTSWELPYAGCTATIDPILAAGTPTFAYSYANLTNLASVTDVTGHGYTGTASALVVPNSDGPCASGTDGSVLLSGSGSSYGFIAANRRVSAPSSQDGLTVLTWFKTTDRGRLVGFGDSATGTSSTTADTLYVTTRGAVAFGLTSGATVSSGGGYADGGWHLATATYAAGTYRLYVDGTLVGTQSGVAAPAPFTGYWRVVFDKMAGWPSSGNGGYSGSIAGTAVYPTALSPSAIAGIYTSTTAH
jgi:signal peptidase I